MAFLSGGNFVQPLDLYTSTADITQRVGAYQENGWGKGFRYVLVGASNLVIGNLLQGPAVDTQFTSMAVPTALTVGQTGAIVITNGSTVVTAGQFAGGSLSVYTAGTVAIGDEYTIVDNGAGANAGAMNVYLDRPLRYAFTTAAKVNMRFNQYASVIQYPTSPTGLAVGAAIYPLTAAQYGWIQSKGDGAVLAGDTSAAGSALMPSTGTAGSTVAQVAANPIVGIALQVGLTTHATAIKLTLD
jgi:hypothetical protein